MARLCSNCNLRVSEKAKYCRRCGFPIDTANVATPSHTGPFTQYTGFFEHGKNRMGLKGVKSLLTDLRKGFRRTQYLVLIFILMFIWLLLPLLISYQVSSIFVSVLSFLTYADAGMTGGFLGFIGGVAGKMLYTYFIVMLFTPFYSHQKPFKGISTGVKLYLNDITAFKNVKDVYTFIFGMSAAFIFFNMLTGNNSAINTVISPIVIIIMLRSIGRRTGIIWDVHRRLFAKSVTKEASIKVITGFITATGFAVLSPLLRSAFICYHIGLFLFASYLVIRAITYIHTRRKSFTRIIPLILILCTLFIPSYAYAAPTVYEIKGVWKLDDIRIIDPDTKTDPKDNTHVHSGHIQRYYAKDGRYTIDYSWDVPPERIYAGNETSFIMNQNLLFESDEETVISSHLKTSMYITYKADSKQDEVIEYFPTGRDFVTENLTGNVELTNTVFFLKMTDYHIFYDKLDKNNSRLIITLQASFGGRVEYIYKLQKSLADGFLTWFVGSGDLAEHKKPGDTVVTGFISILLSLLCASISVGSLTLKRKKTQKPVPKKPVSKKVQTGPVNVYSSVSDNLDVVFEPLSDAIVSGWPKYKEVLIKILSKSKEHALVSKNIYQVEASISRFYDSITGIINNLDAQGYANDADAHEKRGNAIASATGKVIYSNYIFNSLAADLTYQAFIEITDAFALTNMKAGVLSSPAVHLRDIITVAVDANADPEAAYSNMIKGRYGEKLRNMVRKNEITRKTIDRLSISSMNHEQLDSLYMRIATGTTSREDRKQAQEFGIMMTKKTIRQSRAQTYTHEETELVVKSLFERRED